VLFGSTKPAYSLANYLSSVGYFYLFDLEKGKRKKDVVLMFCFSETPLGDFSYFAILLL
jgi:hypothetical protein